MSLAERADGMEGMEGLKVASLGRQRIGGYPQIVTHTLYDNRGQHAVPLRRARSAAEGPGGARASTQRAPTDGPVADPDSLRVSYIAAPLAVRPLVAALHARRSAPRPCARSGWARLRGCRSRLRRRPGLAHLTRRAAAGRKPQSSPP